MNNYIDGEDELDSENCEDGDWEEEYDWDDEDDWDSDDWKGEDLDYYEDVNELIASLGPCGLQYWENLFRTFLARTSLNQEAYDVNDSIQVAKQKGNVFIYINNQLLDLCVHALLRKTFEKQGKIYISEELDKNSIYIEQVEDLYRRREEEVQSSKSFKLLCCEIKQWVESGYSTTLRNPKLAPAILNQLKNKI